MNVTAVAWRKSSYSGDNGGACVEVGITGPAIAVRDSKHPDGPPSSLRPSYLEDLHRPVEGGYRLTQSGSPARMLTGLFLVKGSSPDPGLVFVDEVFAQSLDIARSILKLVPLALRMRAEIP